MSKSKQHSFESDRGGKRAADFRSVAEADQAIIDELINSVTNGAGAGGAPSASVGGFDDDADTQSTQDTKDATSANDPVSVNDPVNAQGGEDAPAEPDPLTVAQAEVEQYKDRFTRLQAEWDNFRKRTATEREAERARAASKLVEQLLPIIDDMERAIEHSKSASEASLKDGIAAVCNKLGDVLAKEGLMTIDPVGEAFDANIHQAVGKSEDCTVPDETVTQVYQKGYQMGDKVLRSAMVIVSTGGPAREPKTEPVENE